MKLRNHDKTAPEVLKLLKTKSSNFWVEEQRKNSLKLFKDAAKRVPAYKDFLKKANINPDKIKTWQDFQTVPSTSKKTYLQNYPPEMLCWDGHIDKPLVYTATSGSTGEPFYFLRGEKLDWQYSIAIEEFLEKRKIKDTGPVLVVVCFGMGLWIGGLITYKAFEIAAIRNKYSLSLITPGFNKKEILNALKKLSPKYSQTILTGYPPLLKDVIDEARMENIDLKKLNIRFLFAAEAITEEFRDYLAKNAHVKNLFLDFISIYGSADIGAMATESTAAILIRRLAKNNKHLFNTIFSPINKTPTLAQYNPLFINFESVNSEILLTGDSAIPLIRYSIGDNGGTFTFDEAEEKLKSVGVNFKKEIADRNLQPYITELPFVYVYERIDLSTSFYGLLIYPEWVKRAILGSEISKYLTGKFTMSTKLNKSHDQYLEINLELAKGQEESDKIEKRAVKIIATSLSHQSSEYREINKGLGALGDPKVILWPYEHPEYFKPGIKQKWVEREIAK